MVGMGVGIDIGPRTVKSRILKFRILEPIKKVEILELYLLRVVLPYAMALLESSQGIV